MAVYTDIGEVELTEFLAAYDIGSLVAYRGIAEGVENSNFMLHTSTGNFILTLYEKRVNAADLPFFLGLMDHLAARGVNCPKPLRMKSGATTGYLAGRPAAIISFLEGIWIRRPEPDHCRQTGAALADFHQKSQNFNFKRPNALSIKAFKPLWRQCETHADELVPGTQVEAELDYLERCWPSDLPRGITHADLFPDNVFFLNGKLSGLIDFYFACSELYAYDLSICLNAWCFERDGAFNLTKAQALISGYQQQRRLSEGEINALPLLARASAMRFMLTRLYDWQNTPEGSLVVKKDPREYWRRLVFHQAVTSPTEYGI